MSVKKYRAKPENVVFWKEKGAKASKFQTFMLFIFGLNPHAYVIPGLAASAEAKCLDVTCLNNKLGIFP